MPLIELTLPAEIHDAWPYLRDPALIRRWFGWDYDGLDHEIEVIFLQEAAVDETDHALQWRDGIQDGDRIELAERSGGEASGRDTSGLETILRVFRNPPPQGFDPIAEGWISFAHQLRFALEHPGQERRTLRLTGGRIPSELPGEPYFRTEHQAAAVADGALALVAAAPDGTATLTVTSFGAEPDEPRWRAWWGEPA